MNELQNKIWILISAFISRITLLGNLLNLFSSQFPPL